MKIGFALSLFVLPASALAFDYVEHRKIDRDAVKLLAPAQQQAFERSAAEEANILMANVSREDPDPLTAHFSPWEIPAIAGDWSTDPTNALIVLFSSDKVLYPFKPLPSATMRNEPGILTSDSKCTPLNQSTPFTVHYPNSSFKKLLVDEDALHAAAFPASGPMQPASDVSAISYANYVWLAHKNISHFHTTTWLGDVPHHEAESGPHDLNQFFRLYRVNEGQASGGGEHIAFGAQDNSVAFYLELHSGAMVFRKLAATRSDPAEKTSMLAFSLYLEQFALHYLNDLVAPGHHLYDCRFHRDGLLNPKGAGRKLYHDHFNDGGRLFYPTKALCTFAAAHTTEVPSLAQHCATNPESPSSIRLYGDGYAFVNPKPGSAVFTAEVAEATAAASLNEYLSTDANTALDPEAFRVINEGLSDPGLVNLPHYNYLSYSRSTMTNEQWRWAVWAEAWLRGMSETLVPAADQPKMKIINRLWNSGGLVALDLAPRFSM